MSTVRISNPPDQITLDDFRSNINKFGGLAKVARYIVRFPDFVRRDLSLLCEAAEFPSRGFTSGDFRYYGPNFKIPFQTQYEDLNLTFLCRDDFRERELFDQWMEIINPTTTFDFSYRDEYSRTIEIFQMSDIGVENNQPATYKFTFEKAYPILLTAQPTTWADENFHRLTVTFTYVKWRTESALYSEAGKFNLISDVELVTSGTTLPYYLAPRVSNTPT